MEEKGRNLLLSVLALAFLVWMGGRWPWSLQALWAAPAVLLFFFLAYEFDVHVPGLGYLNLDHVVAFPAVAALQNPVAAGILGGTGLLASRLYRKGLSGLTVVNLWGSLLTALSVSLGGAFYLSSSRNGPEASLRDFFLLLLAMLLCTAVNWVAFVLGKPAVLKPPLLATLWRAFVSNLGWVALSSPLVAQVVGAVREERYVSVLLGSLTLLVLFWAMRLYGEQQQRTLTLVQATGRQELLQQLAVTAAGSLEKEHFLTTLLAGLRDTVYWDAGVLLVLPPHAGSSVGREPLLVCLEPLPADPHGLKETLLDLLEQPELKTFRLLKNGEAVPLLLPRAGSQLAVPMVTTELAFGLLLLEREPGKEPFTPEEAKFLELALNQIASQVQDDILKRQLLDTNRKLLKQTGYLSQILKISNLLKVHLDVQGMLEKVAEGIREGMGFKTVLVSLYREEDQVFERVAQAGLDDRWEQIREVRPPAEQVRGLLHPKYRVGACYFIGHAEEVFTSFDILPLNPRLPQEPDDWHPMDSLIVPLEDKDGRLLGIISLDEPVDGKVPSLETLRALEVLANQTVNALEGAQVHALTKRQAVMDALTGLFNHGFFQGALAREGREHAQAGLPYAVLMMDLDGFKGINDTYGHLAGDDMLRSVAEVIRNSIRREDIPARYGGEEFAVLLPRCDAPTAEAIAERIRSAVEALEVPVPGEGGPGRVTLSVGVAAFPEDGNDHRAVLSRADQALYEAKRRGKNRVSRPV